MDRFRTEVLVVGGGPVGLCAAMLLAKEGVKAMLVERHPTTSDHPKATVINARSAELLRLWGLEEETRERGLPLELSGFVSWFTRIHGRLLGSLPLVDADSEEFMRRLAQSPTLPVICPQSELEAVLARHIEQLDDVDARFGWRLDSFRQSGESVLARCAVGSERFEVEADYMIGADGSRSFVREQLEIGSSGAGDLEEAVNIHFEAKLGSVIDTVPSVLYWIVNPELQGVIHALDGERRWLLNLKAQEGVDYESEQICERLVRLAVGKPDLDLKVFSVKQWTMRSTLADRYRDGRMFLVGDAAHEMPPTGGFGMNTGIQDAHNLVWKLAAVLRGRAAPELLDTYETERRPVARLNCEQSVFNLQRMIESGLFFDPGDGSLGMIEGESKEAEELRDSIAEEILRQREHFTFDGQDLGFTYGGPGVVPDGSEPPHPGNPVLEYIPSAHPGARAPHAWLESGGEELSTLDLFEGRPVLLIAGEDPGWQAAVNHIDPQHELIELRAVDGSDLADPAGELPGLYGLHDGGAVLVRPDGHVAARFASFPKNPSAALARVTPAIGIDLGASLEQRA